MQSVPVPTKVVSLNPTNGKVYWIQHYVIKFVSDLWYVCGFLHVLWFPPLTKLTAMILLKVALNLIITSIQVKSCCFEVKETYDFLYV